MSGNVNVANYCNFGSNRTSNVRVNQGPGGNSSLSLAWSTDDQPKSNLRSGSQNNYYQRENTYGNSNSNQGGYKYERGNNYQSDYRQQQEDSGNYYQNQNQNRNDPGDINSYYVQQKKPQQQDSYEPFSNSSKPPIFGKRVEAKNENNYENKQSIKIHQTPGGRQNFQIGGDYNYFKDETGNDKVGGQKIGNSPQKSDSYQALRNNYRNMVSNEPQQANYQQEYQQKYMANNYANNSSSSNRSSSQNIYNNNNSNNDPYARNPTYGNSNSNSNSNNYSQQQPNQQSRQPNNLHDVKFGYRVNQPPGGRSNITFG